MPDHIPLPAKQYSVIYADPPWAYQQAGATAKARGTAVKHYPTMTTAEICALPVREIVRGGAACFMWATFPNITEAIKVMEAWGFTYKTAAFVWVKKNRKNGGNFMGMGAYDTAARTDLRDLSAAMDATPWVWRLHEADMCAAHIDERGTDE